MRILIGVLIILLSVAGAMVLIETAPKPQKKPVDAFVPLVKSTELIAGEYRPSWQAGGNANAKPSVKLMAQVTGQIIQLNEQATPGAQLKKGDLLAQIDPANYELLVQQKQAALIQAQSALDVEKGQVKNAENNYKLSKLKLNNTAKSLALREPQLASAQAALNIAQVELEKAKLDLARTQLRMPFDGHVLSVQLSQGSFVGNNTQVFELVDSSEFWLQVKIPQAFASLLDDSQPVLVSKSALPNVTRTAYVKNILPSVDAADRQVQVLIGIKQPLDSHADFAVRFNDYLNVTIFSHVLSNVYEFNSNALNEDGTLWVVDANNHLQLRQTQLVYKGRQKVWANVEAQVGDQLLLSRLQVASVGMPVRIQKQVNLTADEAKQ
ncbi:efflux RND transporter periplasmic adaptor subunit [Oceaniserpentilla sp. 4NH20-0058]|uniref:efflux RND transporter periplasmic adaptor subunit n=1 Tax=Oceaniserpentilla sp. 4NH20-0058 TaxID=3127660 RepID=UPI0031044747